MDLKQLVMPAVQVSIICMVFGFGLKATSEDLLYLVRRPGLLARSLLAVFIIMPIVAVVLDRLFTFRPVVETVLVALALSPIPPLLPMKLGRAGGNTSYALGLMAILALLSIVFVPLSVEILQWFIGRQFWMAPSAIAGVVLKATLLPLAAGMIVRAALPQLAERLEKPLALVAKVLLIIGILALLAGLLPAVWAQVGDGTVLGLLAFLLVGLAVGHVLGGPIRTTRSTSRSRRRAGIRRSPSPSRLRTTRINASPEPSCSILLSAPSSAFRTSRGRSDRRSRPAWLESAGALLHLEGTCKV